MVWSDYLPIPLVIPPGAGDTEDRIVIDSTGIYVYQGSTANVVILPGGDILVRQHVMVMDPAIASPPTYETWHAVSYQNGWSDFGAPYDNVRYRLMPDGNVQFQGACNGGTGTDGTIIFRLPVNYRPDVAKGLAVCRGTTTQNQPIIIINTDGNVQVFGVSPAPAAGVVLDGLHYDINLPT